MNINALRHASPVQLLLWLLGRRQRYRVTGDSMRPLLSPADHVLVNPSAFKNNSPKPGDLVVATHPYKRETTMVKRVRECHPNGDVFVVGDNAYDSSDSRAFGALPAAGIVGRVVSRFP